MLQGKSYIVLLYNTGKNYIVSCCMGNDTLCCFMLQGKRYIVLPYPAGERLQCFTNAEQCKIFQNVSLFYCTSQRKKFHCFCDFVACCKLGAHAKMMRLKE